MKRIECRNHEALGMESGAIHDEQIIASSQGGDNYAPARGRLKSAEKQGAWSAAINDASQWLQVDLGSNHLTVTSVATQGRNGLCNDFMNFLECYEALGMESGAITDGQITASSQWNDMVLDHAAAQGRLHFRKTAVKAGAWVAATRDNSQWLQVDLGNNNFIVTRVATQGRNGGTLVQSVSKYNLQYSDDEVNFQYYKEQGQATNKVK